MKDFYQLLLMLPLFLLVACEGASSGQEPTGEAVSTATAVSENALNTAVPTQITPIPSTPEIEVTVEEDDVETAVATEQPATATVAPSVTPTAIPTLDPSEFAEGALIAVELDGTVGVLLDGVPSLLRDAVVAHIMNKDEAYWDALARRHVTLTKYRLNFRNYKRAGKGQLPLPPEQLWQIELDEDGPREIVVQNHTLIAIDYAFSSTLLTNVGSVAEAEPQLAEIGGVWQEPFILPLDPDFLLQRTGIACVNEAGFPPNSYDSENVRKVYDFSCTPGSVGKLGCHRNEVPALSCLEAVDAFVGRLETAVRFERLTWDEALADQVRIGPFTHADAPDLLVVTEDLLDYRITYEYFEEGDCAIEEDAVGDTGWRRLLRFSATLHNVGGEPLHIGPVVAEDPTTNIFQYNPCHDHFHFSNYGDFFFDGGSNANGSKRAFCVESTNRFSNNEMAPLTHDYSCTFQGIQAGWVDEYAVGLDVQWIDITDVEFEEEVTAATVGFESNSDQFLCEGTAVLNEEGEPLYETTGLRTQTGLPISRPQCDFVDDWQINNLGTEELLIPAVGSFVTTDCLEDLFGALRNCGFSPYQPAQMCAPGETISIEIELDEPAVLRSCEVSSALGVGVACTFSDSISNNVVGLAERTTVQFVCPRLRDYEPDPDDEDAPEIMGGYALYLAPYFDTP